MINKNSINTSKHAFDSLSMNGLKFARITLGDLKKSDYESAIVHLSIAIELLLKARLASEHWTLIVKKFVSSEKLLSGDFNTISLNGNDDSVIKKLQELGFIDAKNTIHKMAIKAIEDISKARNILIHFSSLNNDEAYYVEIIHRAFYYLFKVLHEEWLDVFVDYNKDLLVFKLEFVVFSNFSFENPDKDKIVSHNKTMNIPLAYCSRCSEKTVPIVLKYGLSYNTSECINCLHKNKILSLSCLVESCCGYTCHQYLDGGVWSFNNICTTCETVASVTEIDELILSSGRSIYKQLLLNEYFTSLNFVKPVYCNICDVGVKHKYFRHYNNNNPILTLNPIDNIFEFCINCGYGLIDSEKNDVKLIFTGIDVEKVFKTTRHDLSRLKYLLTFYIKSSIAFKALT